MTIFDLMDIYFPDKKRTISRLRSLDRNADLAALIEVEERRKHNIYPQKPNDMRDWLSEFAYATDNEANNLRILSRLNVLAKDLNVYFRRSNHYHRVHRLSRFLQTLPLYPPIVRLSVRASNGVCSA